MSTLLFPGRHLVNTAFQARYLQGILRMPVDALSFLGAPPPAGHPPVTQIVFAITSANQQHSRFNSIPFYARAIGVDRFARALEQGLPFDYRIVGIPHYRPTPRFAEYVLKEIEAQTEGSLRLTPANCIVVSCTPEVQAQYQRLGFAILPAEGGQLPKPATPNALVEHLVTVGEAWETDLRLRQELAPTSLDLWHDFPDIPRRILRLWRDPLLNSDGSLTSERDYAAYAFGMGNREIIRLKYEDVREALLPGKIVDEGCADGALLAEIAADFPDSDLIGIEITGEFMARALERQRAGAFGGSYVHFHQRNVTQPIFEANSVDTTLCNATIHELFSYGAGAATVHAYFRLKFAQTAPGGRLVIRDVVGPHDREREVWLWLNETDGAPEGALETLSTFGLFLRFAREFRPRSDRPVSQPPFPIVWKPVTAPASPSCATKTPLQFMSKKDYLANWSSEMHERFAFWSFAEWKAALADAGFAVLEDPNAPPPRVTRLYRIHGLWPSAGKGGWRCTHRTRSGPCSRCRGPRPL